MNILIALAVLFALLSSLAYGVVSALQQVTAAKEPIENSLKFTLISGLLKNKSWLLSNLVDVFGYVFQFFALKFGPIALVEPIIVSSLIFALPANSILRSVKISKRELVAAALCAAGLGTFLAAARPSEIVITYHRLNYGLLALLITTILLPLTLIASRLSPNKKTFMLAVISGVIFGHMAATTNVLSRLLFSHGILYTIKSLTPVYLVAAAIFGLLTSQSAYQSGPLRLSLPILTIAQPIVAIFIGQLLLGESIRTDTLSLALEILSAVLTTIGVFYLSKLQLS